VVDVEIRRAGDRGLEIRRGGVRCRRDVALRRLLRSSAAGSQTSPATGPDAADRHTREAESNRGSADRRPCPCGQEPRCLARRGRPPARSLGLPTWTAAGEEPWVAGEGSGGPTLAALSGSNRGSGGRRPRPCGREPRCHAAGRVRRHLVRASRAAGRGDGEP